MSIRSGTQAGFRINLANETAFVTGSVLLHSGSYFTCCVLGEIEKEIKGKGMEERRGETYMAGG